MFYYVRELRIQALTEQSSGKFTELFSTKCRTYNHFSGCYTFHYVKSCKFSRTLFRKCLYTQLLNSSLNFTKLISYVSQIIGEVKENLVESTYIFA